ncbi:MAG: hypothetical protein HUU16_16755 [Candidatus Omnitrophica bacterium]|nr:hypothetical protein [Candidatus Omnitrophota bacterium]
MQSLSLRFDRKKILIVFCFSILAAQAPAVGEEGVSTVATSPIALSGQASGGTLTLAHPINREAKYIAIQTTAGESAASVARRLADAISAADPFRWWGPSVHTAAEQRVNVRGSTILDLPGRRNGGGWVLGGTETGLGIPPPPVSLSASYDPTKDEVLVNWVSPPGGYDSIALVTNGIFPTSQPGQSTSCAIPMIADADMGGTMDILVVGYRKDVPSNAGAITVDRSSQEEMINTPFSLNVAPNWSTWSDEGSLSAVQDGSAVSLEMGDRGDVVAEGKRLYPYPGTPGEKRFFQVVKTHKPESNAGVWRKFVGLASGHRYRVHLRVSTLGMSDNQGDWTASVHAAHNDPSGRDLTTAQLSGMAPLPDGESGPQAGRVVGLGPSTSTRGNWMECSTGGDAPGKAISDLTLPEGVSSITVWLRCRGPIPEGVGLDWIKLEDLTESSP